MQARRAGFVAAIGAATVLLLWKVPQWQTAPCRALLTPTDLLLVENSQRQTLVVLLGTGVVIAALVVLWRRVTSAERAVQASLANAHEAQRSERVSRAVAQLADDRQAVRIGAIYALEQLAAESMAQHWPIIEVLCAYLRARAGWSPERPKPARLPTDEQTVLTVLGRRTLAYERSERLDLRGIDLRGASLDGVHFDRAILADAHLDDASLKAAHLETADLRGAHLSGADLVEANLQRADLRGAHLEAAYLVEAHLEGADLGGAFMAGAYLGGAHLEGADLGGAQLEGAYLYKAHLEGASLHGARVLSAIGIHRDERGRIEHTAASEAATAPPPRKPRPSAAASPVSLRRKRGPARSR